MSVSYHSTAQVLQHAIVGLSLGTLPSSTPGGTWPVFAGHMPAAPDNAICVYDTSGIKQGRVQSTGRTSFKCGWQVRVRGNGYAATHEKAVTIEAGLDTLRRTAIVIDAVPYTITSVTRTSGILSIGQDPRSGTLDAFTFNGTATISRNM